MEYPEEIYQVFSDDMSGSGRRHAYEVGHNIGYLKGLAERPDPLTGYSNLTAAIDANEPIDYEKLDGLKVQCVKPNIGELQGELKRFSHYYPFTSSAWWDDDVDSTYVSAFNQAWKGENGWTLWVEGEIPLVRKTADQLEVGTYFLGQAWGDDPYLAYVGRPLKTNTVKTIYYAPEMLKSITPASEWVVLEEYGPFQKPDTK